MTKLIKIISILLIMVVLSVGLISCSSSTISSTMPAVSLSTQVSQIVTEVSTQASVTTSPQPSTRTITDIAKRTVTVPAVINRVVCLHPIPDYMVWRLAPDKLVSISRVFSVNLKAKSMLFPDSEINKLQALTVVPVYFDELDPEEILALNPDVVISMTKDTNLDSLQTKLGIPIVSISKDTLNDYAASFRLMGDLLGNQAEGNELADYWQDLITRVTSSVSTISEQERLKVYYASHDGPLSTVGTATVMASIIRLAGGIDFASANNNIAIKSTDEHSVVSMEQVLVWNPDVIITKTAAERDEITISTQWADVNAVKNKRVYCCLKYEAMDGIMSLISLGWVANSLYPEKIDFALIKESQAFYAAFYRNDAITESQIMEEQK